MPNVLAIVAHPDDIEFVMAGTLLQLAARGWGVHYMNVANGCCGSMSTDRAATADIRLEEARSASKLIPSIFHPPICDDMGIFYEAITLSKIASVIRQAYPTIVLTHSPQDYMEDHEAACRLAVSGTFVKSMPNFKTDPPVEPVDGPVAIYHAQPHGNKSPLGHPIHPDVFVNTAPVLDKKTQMLRCHASQEGWLDETQKMSSYVDSMIANGSTMGILSKRFSSAEGFRRHIHLGLSHEGFDPMMEALQNDVCNAT